MAFQIQTHYRGKIRQLYIDKPLDNYSSLVEYIVTNISSLFGVAFQILYVNDEGNWITLSESTEDVCDLFRCAKQVESTEFRRIKIKILEGCSPVVDTSEKRQSVEGEGAECNHGKRRRLFGSENREYKTPIEMDIHRKSEEIRLMDEELAIVESQYNETASKFPSAENVRRHGGRQCGKCHLYTNHRKNTCPNDMCVTAEMCGDISKHADETSELREIMNKKTKLSGAIQKERTELQLKIKCLEKLYSSFSKRMELELIESDRSKYLVQTSFGLKPRQALINEDVAILERHYNGKVPASVASERAFFASIIEKHKIPAPKSRTNPMFNILASNRLSVYPVRLPTRSPASASPSPPPPLPGQTPPLPTGPPPPLPPYDTPTHPGFYQGYWAPWMMAQSSASTYTRDGEEERLKEGPGNE